MTIPEPADGAHVLMVRAVDLDGNIDPTPDIYEWLIEGPPDTTAPDTIFVAGPPAVTPLFDALVDVHLQRGRRRVRVLDRRWGRSRAASRPSS